MMRVLMRWSTSSILLLRQTTGGHFCRGGKYNFTERRKTAIQVRVSCLQGVRCYRTMPLHILHSIHTLLHSNVTDANFRARITAFYNPSRLLECLPCLNNWHSTTKMKQVKLHSFLSTFINDIPCCSQRQVAR